MDKRCFELTVEVLTLPDGFDCQNICIYRQISKKPSSSNLVRDKKTNKKQCDFMVSDVLRTVYTCAANERATAHTAKTLYCSLAFIWSEN